MISLKDITSAYKNSTKEERTDFLETILPDIFDIPVFSEWLNCKIGTFLATSEHQLLKRVTVLEKVTGKYEYEEEEEHEPSLKEEINKLKENIENAQILPLEPKLDYRETFEPNGKTQKAAIELIKYACNRPVVEGFKAITPSVLHQFRKHILSEDLRPDTKNPREWKKEITEIILDLVPTARKDKKGNNRGIRLLFPRNFDISMTKCKIDVSY